LVLTCFFGFEVVWLALMGGMDVNSNR